MKCDKKLKAILAKWRAREIDTRNAKQQVWLEVTRELQSIRKIEV